VRRGVCGAWPERGRQRSAVLDSKPKPETLPLNPKPCTGCARLEAVVQILAEDPADERPRDYPGRQHLHVDEGEREGGR